jgi:hypothetical protein
MHGPLLCGAKSPVALTVHRGASWTAGTSKVRNKAFSRGWPSCFAHTKGLGLSDGLFQLLLCLPRQNRDVSRRLEAKLKPKATFVDHRSRAGNGRRRRAAPRNGSIRTEREGTGRGRVLRGRLEDVVPSSHRITSRMAHRTGLAFHPPERYLRPALHTIPPHQRFKLEAVRLLETSG